MAGRNLNLDAASEDDYAASMRGEAFTPGLYLKQGYTITSRCCYNHCWFCSVSKHEGALRELTRGNR